jgi:hypothetical protein
LAWPVQSDQGKPSADKLLMTDWASLRALWCVHSHSWPHSVSDKYPNRSGQVLWLGVWSIMEVFWKMCFSQPLEAVMPAFAAMMWWEYCKSRTIPVQEYSPFKTLILLPNHQGNYI